MRDVEKERKAFEAKSVKRWGRGICLRGANGEYIVPAVRAAWAELVANPPVATSRKRRKMRDEFNVEIHTLSQKNRFRWMIIKSFDDSDQAYQYERQYGYDNPETPTRVKVQRVPVADDELQTDE